MCYCLIDKTKQMQSLGTDDRANSKRTSLVTAVTNGGSHADGDRPGGEQLRYQTIARIAVLCATDFCRAQQLQQNGSAV